MKYFVTSSKDATVYSGSKNQNTGIDQILEVSRWKTSIKDDYSRAFIEFDITDISSSISSGDIPTNATYSLNMYSTKLREIPRSFEIEIYPLSQSWDMGLGKRQDEPIMTDGVSFRYRISADVTSSEWTNHGGDFITTTTSSFTYNQKTVDLDADVTDIVNGWITGSYDNNGFAIKLPDSVETGSLNYGTVNFFSSETHTIYKPKLSVEWDDSSNSRTGSVSEVDSDNVYLTIENLRGVYDVNETYKFKIFARNQFPTLTFTTGSPYSVNNYIPSSSKYSIVDNVTGDVIVPFSDSSKISSNLTGSYFRQNFKGWEAERFYKILIKVDDGDNVNIIDNNFTFKLAE